MRGAALLEALVCCLELDAAVMVAAEDVGHIGRVAPQVDVVTPNLFDESSRRPHANTPMLPWGLRMIMAIFVAADQIRPIILNLISELPKIFRSPFEVLTFSIRVVNKFCAYPMCTVMVTFVVTSIYEYDMNKLQCIML